MWYWMLLIMAGPALIAQTLTILPATITECKNGAGRAILTWTAPDGASVQIRIGDRNGAPLTGWEPSTGNATTGDWVTDGMVFVLVNDAAYEYARATAHLNCGGTVDTTGAALTSSNAYFPLQVGNQWVYRTNDRAVTSSYETQTITGTTAVSTRTYFVLETRAGADGTASQSLVRADDQGRIYLLTGTSEQVWLDPTGGAAAILQTKQQNVAVATPAGVLPVGLQYQTSGNLLLETGTFARGLGLLNSSTTMLTGSSGGFTNSLDLIESRVGTGLHFAAPAASVQLAAETADLHVTAKQVTNCAIPCYFVACGIAGADPTGTYKPCFQARVRVGQAQCSAPSVVDAALELLDSTNHSVYSHSLGLTVPSGQCETVGYHQVPLYSAPNVPLPSGDYSLNLRVTSGTVVVGSASVSLRID